jgi:acetyl/propionyl-CoA carboxylase alpha subunit
VAGLAVAEDPAFVERLAAAGIVFLGPPAAAMRRLGDKIEAKRLAESLAVPVTPWSGAEVDGADAAARCAERIGYPLVIKATAGGGGRGIRVVAEPSALPDALRAARAEAEGAFGDGRLFLERKVDQGRHIEVQIAADEHGSVRALGCRDCSVQRRHQKLIEEAPALGLAAALRHALEESAIRLARAVGYVGVGTVEFLVAGDDYFFLEVNPRLQVEHTVTEAITGLDLVQLQIRIARGESIADLPAEERGWAIEARLCADDPDAGFQPAPGRIARFDPALGPRVRIDSGVIAGSVIPAAFDSLIAKVIATGDTREDARARLTSALTDFELVVEGGASNKGFLLDVLADPAFRAGAVDTGWLDRFNAARATGEAYAVEGLIAAAILAYQRTRAATRLNFFADTTTVMPSRVPQSHGQQITLTYRGETYRLEVFAIGAWRYRVQLGEQTASVTLRETGNHAARLQINDRELRVLYDAGAAGLRLEVEGQPLRLGWDSAGVVRASSPAMVVAVDVQTGDRVAAGQPLGILEAMKMEVAFSAPVAGVVTEVRVRRGQQVRAGDVMVVIDAGAASGGDAPRRRVRFPDTADPLAPLFAPGAEHGSLGTPDIAAADAARLAVQRAAIDAVREEVRRVLLGYDASRKRTHAWSCCRGGPDERRCAARAQQIGAELRTFADVE